MESKTSQNKSETTEVAYTFIASHSASISSNKKEFSGAWMCDPGPSFARCQSIENNPIIIDKDCPIRASPIIPATVIFKIVWNSEYYSDCSLGIHTNVEKFFHIGGRLSKSRIGHEVSVHGHRVFGPKSSNQEWRHRLSRKSTNVKEMKNTAESAKDWMDKEWADGDVIKLVLTNPFLNWFWNGIEQSSIDVSDENYRIVSETLQGNSSIQSHNDESECKKRKDGNTEDVETKWCFYVRGICMKVRIEDKDLTDKEYEELRDSYADRLKAMNDKKAEQGPCDPDDW